LLPCSERELYRGGASAATNVRFFTTSAGTPRTAEAPARACTRAPGNKFGQLTGFGGLKRYRSKFKRLREFTRVRGALAGLSST
jgi:hypothetical protein